MPGYIAILKHALTFCKGPDDAGMGDPASLALRRLGDLVGEVAYSPRPGVLPVPMAVSAGVERQDDPRRYRWDGLRRDHDVKCPRGVPHAIVQWTLAGEGRYADAAGERALGPGRAFIALVPSAHRYWLPPGGPPWRFCWFAVAHAQLVERLRLQVAAHGAVLDLPAGAAAAARLIDVVEGLLRGRFADEFALEAALWAFVIEADRHHDRRIRPPAGKQALLDRVRELVLAEPSRPLGVADIAARLGWHRVHFAARFRAAAGFPPGAYLTSLRLEEARRRLREGASPLAAVALAVGLGSAARLCRLFRRHYGATPGSFGPQGPRTARPGAAAAPAGTSGLQGAGVSRRASVRG